ncbi:hypothetical protein GCM10009678_66540 [Actinomadura kijaniata]
MTSRKPATLHPGNIRSERLAPPGHPACGHNAAYPQQPYVPSLPPPPAQVCFTRVDSAPSPRPRPPTPWAQTERDPDQVLDELRERFPAVVMWWGEWTGSYWAFLPDDVRENDRFLTAATADAFTQQLAQASSPSPSHEPAPTPLAYMPEPSLPPIKPREDPPAAEAAPAQRPGLLRRLLTAMTRRRPTPPRHPLVCGEACCAHQRLISRGRWSFPC